MTARAACIGEADGRHVVAEQFLRPDQVGRDAVLDLVLRGTDLAVVEVRLRVEGIGLEAHEAVVGPQFVDVLVGVADVEVEVAEVGIPGFRQACREYRAAAFARVGDDVIAARGEVVDRTPVGGCSILRAAAFVDVVAIIDFRQHDVRGDNPVVTEDVFGTEAVLPGAQDLEVGRHGVDVDVGIEADELMELVKCRRRIGQALHRPVDRCGDARRGIEERRQEAREGARDAVARVAVGEDDQRRAAAEQARAAANRQAVRRGPVEPEARQHEVLAVEVGRVVKAIARGERRILRNRVAIVVAVEAQAEFQRQVAVRRPLVLEVEAVDGQAEVGFGKVRIGVRVVGVAVQHEADRPVLEIVEREEHVVALRERQEQVAHRVLFLLEACREQVVAELVVRLDLDQLGLVVEFVRVAKAVAAGRDRAAGRREDREIRRRRVDTDLAVLDVLDAELELGREAVRPLREQARGICRQLLVDVVAVRLQHRDFGEVVEQHVTVCHLVGEGCAVVLVDVPVELEQDLLVLVVVAGRKRARIEAVFRLQDAPYPVHIRLRNARDIFDGLRV